MSKKRRYALNKNKYLLEHEYDRLIHILKSFINKDKRNCVMIYLALFTGARAQEILNITIDDLDSYDEVIYIKGLKGSNDREIPLPSWLFKECLKLSPEQGKLFPITYNRLLQIWHLYRPVAKKFHSLRHTFAIRLYKKTKDIRLVQVALGHRNITNTMVYADYVYTQQEMRRLILL